MKTSHEKWQSAPRCEGALSIFHGTAVERTNDEEFRVLGLKQGARIGEGLVSMRSVRGMGCRSMVRGCRMESDSQGFGMQVDGAGMSDGVG